MNKHGLPDHFVAETPDGDNRQRQVCSRCGFIHYHNPKVVVGSVVHHDGKVLLCRRAIEPRRGLWTLPAGYMEIGETVAEAARREAREEAEADIVIDALLAVYTIKRLGQVQLMHVAHLATPHIAAGEESLEVGLFAFADIPWDELAFPSVRWALTQYREIAAETHFAPFSNPDGETGDLV